MSVSLEQRRFYQRALAVTRQEINQVEVQIRDELARVKDRVAEQQNAQQAARLSLRVDGGPGPDRVDASHPPSP